MQPHFRPFWRRVRRLALWLGIPYLLVLLMLAGLQRMLIYLPTREPEISWHEAGFQNGELQSVSVTADDGLELHGWQLFAAGHVLKGPDAIDRHVTAGGPVVLYFCGNGGHRGFRGRSFEMLTGLGADVYCFDYRGYGDNSGSPTEASIAADAAAVWRWLTQSRQIKPERIVLYGESLGAGVAVRLAAEACAAGAAPAGLVLRCPFTSLPDAAAVHYPWLPVRWLLIDRYPSQDRIGQVSCPLLVVHAGRDRIVPIALGRRLFGAAPALSAGGLPKQFVEIAGAGHNDLFEAAGLHYRDSVREFFESVFKR